VQVACVGGATARTLREHGVIADVVPSGGGGGAVLAEAMSQVVMNASHKRRGKPSGPTLKAIRVVFPRARDGRPEAVNILRKLGADVEVIPLYRSVPADADVPAVTRGLQRLHAGEVQALGFFAPSQVHALFDLLGEHAREVIAACPVIAAIGHTTEAALTARGVDVHVVPTRPDGARLIAAIARAWRERDTTSG
jgi:uroporphyrinogen III methyltransferase/synthase